MPSFTHDDRILSLTTPLGANALLLESFRGSEGISELFDFTLEVLATPNTSVTAAALIGNRVTVEIEVADDGTTRPINGMVCALQAAGGDSDFNTYHLRVVPSLWLLTLNTQTRVFQSMTVIDIIKKVLTSYSLTPTDNTEATYTALDYCTQYRETDFAFISRLMEQFGIFFYFTHSSTAHTLVLADTSAQLAACTPQDTFRFAPERETRNGFYDLAVHTFLPEETLSTGQTSLWDYRWRQFAASKSSTDPSATAAPLGANSHDHYDFADSASAFLKTESADGNTVTLQTQLQNVLRDEIDAASSISHGSSNASVFQPGLTFTLTGYPQADANTKHLLRRVVHHARQRPTYRTEDTPFVTEPYTNSFLAQPAALTYRTPRRTPKPRVSGVVTGKVVAPSGDESFLDKYGRVCVQFWWDRTRQPNTTDNTLLRVAQSWAGNGWGTYFWPRLNDEVLIDFLDGDPDAPIVVGSLYNGLSLPKYDPSQQGTRSGIATRSSKQGAAANANELRFDDLKGSEQIFLNAEKDFDVHVENDHHTQIDKDRHLIVTGKQFTKNTGEVHTTLESDEIDQVGGDLHLAVTGKSLEKVGGDKGETYGANLSTKVSANRNLDIGANRNEKVGANYSLQITGDLAVKAASTVIDSAEAAHIKGGMTVVIDGGMGVCLSGPGGFISIDPSGVTIQGLLVKINSGGASLQGAPAICESPQAPTAPKSPTAPTWPGDDPRAS